jgi:hypothetical protein
MILIRAAGSSVEGVLSYKVSEHSFMFDAASPHDLLDYAGGKSTASVTVGTLQVEFGIASRRALFVWGYHPMATWATSVLKQPDAEPGALLLESQTSLESGISVPLAPVGSWRTVHDPSTGWIRIASDPRPDDEVVQIADGTVLGSVRYEFHSIWLRPIFE